MLKFLRKYNKFILVIGGSLLMIAFLAPQAIQQLGQIRNRPVGTYDGRTIKEKELFLASDELRAINALGSTGGTANVLLGLANETSSDAELHWYLLTKEAEQGGFIGSDLDGRSYYPILAQQIALAVVSSNPQFQGLPPQFLQQFAAEQAQQWLEQIEQSERSAAGAGRFTTLQDLHKAVAKLRGVQRMRNAYNNAAKTSAPRLKSIAADLFRAVQIDHIAIPAVRYLDAVAEPTEAEIRAHFETYADTNANQNEFGIGYLQPRRVKIEWLTVSRESIENAVTIPALELSKYWLLNRERFPGEFSAERTAVAAELKRKRVDTLLVDADRYVRAYLLRESRALQPDGDYYELPADWATTRPGLEAIAASLVERFKEAEDIDIATPTIGRRTDSWQTPADLGAIEGFQASQVKAGSIQLFGVAAPFQVRELSTPEFPVNQNIPIQVGLLAAQFPLIESNGTRRYFRVIDARGVSAPGSLDEVREQVVTNLKRLRAYDLLLAELDGYAEVAKAGGLNAVVEAMNAGISETDTTNRVSIIEGTRLGTRPQSGVSPVLQDQAVLDTIFAASASLDPTVEPETIPLEDRVFTATSKRRLNAVVGRFDRMIPLTNEDFRLAYQQVVNASIQNEVADLGVQDDPFSFERLRERHRWEFLGNEAKSRAEEAALDDADAADAANEPEPSAPAE